MSENIIKNKLNQNISSNTHLENGHIGYASLYNEY